MASPEYIEKKLNELTRSDWQYIYASVQDRFVRSDAKPGEPPNSKAYKEEKARILTGLMSKAFG